MLNISFLIINYLSVSCWRLQWRLECENTGANQASKSGFTPTDDEEDFMRRCSCTSKNLICPFLCQPYWTHWWVLLTTVRQFCSDSTNNNRELQCCIDPVSIIVCSLAFTILCKFCTVWLELDVALAPTCLSNPSPRLLYHHLRFLLLFDVKVIFKKTLKIFIIIIIIMSNSFIILLRSSDGQSGVGGREYFPSNWFEKLRPAQDFISFKLNW